MRHTHDPIETIMGDRRCGNCGSFVPPIGQGALGWFLQDCPGPKPAGDTEGHIIVSDEPLAIGQSFEITGSGRTDGRYVVTAVAGDAAASGAQEKPPARTVTYDRASWDIPTTFPIRLGLRCG